MNEAYAQCSIYEKTLFWSGVVALAPIAAWLLVTGIYGVLSFAVHLLKNGV